MFSGVGFIGESGIWKKVMKKSCMLGCPVLSNSTVPENYQLQISYKNKT